MRVHSVVTSILLLSVAAYAAEPQVHPVQTALDAGQIDEAAKLIEKIPEHQDAWLGKLALAQLQAGNADDAKNTLRRIHTSSELTNAATSIAQQSRGGATGADFDSLINLITTTVEPDSWDDVGGPGTVMAFPGGVAVDAKGVVSKAQSRTHNHSLARMRARSPRETGNQSVHESSKLRMISLPRLERELKIRAAMGESPTEAMKHMAGIFEIQYVFVFSESQDVVIAGPAAGWQEDENGRAVTATGRPVALLDDFVSILRNGKVQQGRFGCSIDPKQENLAATKAFLSRPTGTLKPWQTKRWVDQIRRTLGLQDIRIYGLAPSSHAARVIVEADYHMKLIGMGLEPSVDGLESYLDSIDRKTIPKSMDVLRWWFTLKPDGVTRSEDGNAFAFASEVVRLQCDNELLDQDGTRSSAGQSSERNQQFAHQFTQAFGQLRREYPLYGQLDHLFRMALVAGVLNSSQVADAINWEAEWFTKVLRPARGIAPTEVASIVNHRVINRRHVVVGVSGGVTVNIADELRQLRTKPVSATIQSAKTAANRQWAIESENWWWD